MFVYDSQLATQGKAISYGYGSDDKGLHRADADTHGLLISTWHPAAAFWAMVHWLLALTANAGWPVEDAIKKVKVDRRPLPAAISKVRLGTVTVANEIVSDGSSSWTEDAASTSKMDDTDTVASVVHPWPYLASIFEFLSTRAKTHRFKCLLCLSGIEGPVPAPEYASARQCCCWASLQLCRPDDDKQTYGHDWRTVWRPVAEKNKWLAARNIVIDI